MAAGFNLLLDVQDLPVLADDERPAFRNASPFVDDAVFLRGLLRGVAQQRVVEFQLFGEFRVQLDGVAACTKVRDVEFLQGLAALTERLAFDRSPRCVGLRVPRYDDS